MLGQKCDQGKGAIYILKFAIWCHLECMKSITVEKVKNLILQYLIPQYCIHVQYYLTQHNMLYSILLVETEHEMPPKKN